MSENKTRWDLWKTMSVEEVTRYVTSDGREFKSDQEAKRHERDLLCQAVDDFLKEVYPDGHRPTTISVVEKVCTEESAFRKLESIFQIANR